MDEKQPHDHTEQKRMDDIMDRLELGPPPQFTEDLDPADVIPDRLPQKEPPVKHDVDIDDQVEQHTVRGTKAESSPSAKSSASTFISPSGKYPHYFKSCGKTPD